MGRAGFETATLGLNVREEPLRRDAAGGNVLQLSRVATAANCTELQVTDANPY